MRRARTPIAPGEPGVTGAGDRRDGAECEIAWATGITPLGRVVIGTTARGICALVFAAPDAARPGALRREFPAARLVPLPASSTTELGRWMAALHDSIAGKPVATDLPLDLRGTPFQLRVWRYLRNMPRGQTRSYAEVAQGIGRPHAARAVARACAANHVAVFIPCHRVVRASGELAGYRWGARRKRALLEAEGALTRRQSQQRPRD